MNKRKLLGIILVVAALIFLVWDQVIPAIQEHQFLESAKSELSEALSENTETDISEIDTPEVEPTESTESSSQETQETIEIEVLSPTEDTAQDTEFPWVEPSFAWYDELNIGDVIGVIKIEDLGIETALTYGASERYMISKNAGLHEQLSWNNHLTVLGHNMANGTIFHKLVDVEEGMDVVLETKWGTYNFKVIEAKDVNPDDYQKDNYKVLSDGDMSLVTCTYINGEKWRKIAICQLSAVL